MSTSTSNDVVVEISRFVTSIYSAKRLAVIESDMAKSSRNLVVLVVFGTH
jgi:hypothetical protein